MKVSSKRASMTWTSTEDFVAFADPELRGLRRRDAQRLERANRSYAEHARIIRIATPMNMSASRQIARETQ